MPLPEPGQPVELDAASRSGVSRARLAATAGVILSAGLGIAIVKFPPLLVLGAALAALFVIWILHQPYAGLLLYTIIFIVRPAELYPVLAPLRLERLVGVLALGSMLFHQYSVHRTLMIDRSRTTVFMGSLLLISMLSVPFSFWPTRSFEAVVEMVKVGVFYVLVAQLLDSPRRIRTFTYLYCALIGYIAITSLHAYFTGSLKFAQGIDRAVGVTSAGGDPNHLGTTMAATLPLMVWLASTRWLALWRAVFAAGVVVLFITMAVTGSRASMLGFLASLVAMWWLSSRRVLFGGLIIATVILAFISLPDQYQTRYASMTEEELDASSQGRVEAWKAGTRMAFDRPVGGVGIGVFAIAYANGYSPEGSRRWLESHSLYVQLAAELGIPGLLVFLGLVWSALRTNRRELHHLSPPSDSSTAITRSILNGVFIGLIVLLVSGIFGHSLLRRTWYVYSALVVAVSRTYAAERLRAEGDRLAVSSRMPPD